MRTLYIFIILVLFQNVLQAQVATQRLSPVVTASESEVCPNDEVEIKLSYTVPNNNSILFNGLDEFANIPASPAFDFGAGTSFTIEFYLKTSSVTAQPQGLVTKGDPTGASFQVALMGGQIAFGINDGTNNVAFNGFTNVSDNNWHHVAVVVERTSNATIYVDGAYDNDANIAFVGNITNTSLVRIGAGELAGTPNGFYTGAIDEVRIWNTDLTTAQLNSRSQIHINPNSTANPNLVGYWDLNELAGPQIIDCSPTGATGTLVNAASFSADAPVLGWNFIPQWNNGQNTQTIFVNPLDTATYTVKIGYCKYFSTDSVTVNVIDCEVIDESSLITSVWAPNAFTPNGDYKNDLFHVQASYITYYEIMIFNRFGNILYHSRNILNSWDGTFEGDRVKDDVYSYVITYRDREGEQHKQYGTVTVMH